MQKNVDSVTKKLLKQFSILPTKKDGSKTVVPAIHDYDTGNLRPIQMDTDVQRHYKTWASDLTNSEELKNRQQRYRDIDFMIQNSGWMSLAAKLYANETISPDENGKIIYVYARDKKVETAINTFFEEIGLNRSVLENIAFDIATKSDSFLIRSIDPQRGITGITPITPYEVSSRFEFSSIEEFKKETKGYLYSTNSESVSLEDIYQVLTDRIKNKDYAANYKRYHFGFGLSDNKIILPPWAVSHFRRFTTQSEFAPFGRPLLINSLSLFREYMSGKNLLAMARVAKFPKEVFKVHVDENMTPVERIIAVNEARQEYYNLVNLLNGKEDTGIGQAIWTAIETFEYELQQNTLDLGDIADIELIKDELIASTLVPKGYLISGEASWGDAGKALLQQSKIFAREIYTNQTALLSDLTDMVKTHFVLTNAFDGYDTEFELKLAFPVKEQSGDNITIQKDTMDLAQAVIDNLKTALAIDSIPTEVVKDILQKYAAFDRKDLDRWMKDIQATVDLEITQPEPKFTEPKYTEKLNKAMNRMSESVFRESYFNAKQQLGLTEGVFNGQHYYSTRTMNEMDKIKFDAMKEFEGTKTKKIEG